MVTPEGGALMDVVGNTLEWLTDPGNWSGSNGVPVRMWEHVHISGLAVLLACAVALPVGMYVGHRRRFEFLAISVGNIGRALPSFGVLALVFPFSLRYLPGIGFYPTLITLVLLAVPPILTNSYVGIKGVDADAIEAARGMGLSEREILLQVELPLASPLIVAGMRIAAVQVVATATLGALVAWGGLGRFIVDGLAVRSLAVGQGMLLAGAVLVALLAVATELLFGYLQRAAARRAHTGAPAPVPGRPDDAVGVSAA